MRKALFGLMLTALLAAGCVDKAPFTWPEADPAAPQSGLRPAREHVAPVRADQVTSENARQTARALEEELENDREALPPK